MMKAIFLSYTGVVLPKRGNEYRELLDALVQYSNLKDSDTAAEWLGKTIRTYKSEACGDAYQTETELLRRMLEENRDSISLSCPTDRILILIQNCLMYTPVSDELANFLVLSRKPVYIISDCPSDYAAVEMKRNHLHVHGVVCSDEAKAYRDRKEIYLKALERADVKAEEAVYVGEYPQFDMIGAKEAGMNTVLLDRRGDYRGTEFRRIRSLSSMLANMGE